MSSKPKSSIDWVKEEQTLTRQLQPLGASSWDRRVGGNYLRTFRRLGDSEANRAATEIDDRGMIAAARGEVLVQRTDTSNAVDTRMRWINAAQRAGELIAGVSRYLGALRQLGIEPPWFIGVALLGLSSCRLSVDPPCDDDEAETFEGSEIIAPLITVEFDSESLVTGAGIVALVRPGLDYVAREFNYLRFPDV